MSTIRFIISFVFFCVTAAELPDFVHVCHRSDPKLTRCLRKSVDLLKPKLADGIPELHIPPLDPLDLADITLSGGNDATFYKAIGKNIKVHGASKFQVSKLKADVPNLTFFVGVKFPFLRFLSDVDVNGRVLLTPIKARGKLETNATNVAGNAIVKINIYQDKGVNKMNFNMDLDLKSADLSIHVSDLVGDEFIGQFVNEALAQSKEDIFKIIKPVAQETAAKVILEMINKISKNFSYDEIFPE